MALVRWEPARELDNLQSDMNRVFDSFFGRRGTTAADQRWIPAMDLVETEHSLVLRADLPGMRRDDIEVEVKDGVLTVSGERKAEHEAQREGYHRIERSFGRFSRSLGLPRGIDPGAVEANFEAGVLEVRMPKPEERKSTRVAVAGDDGGEANAIETEARDAEPAGATS